MSTASVPTGEESPPAAASSKGKQKEEELSVDVSDAENPPTIPPLLQSSVGLHELTNAFLSRSGPVNATNDGTTSCEGGVARKHEHSEGRTHGVE